MKTNRHIIITDHACSRYLERFQHTINTGSEEGNLKVAKAYLLDVWNSARYLCDDAGGILFRTGDMDMLVKDKKLITVMRVKKNRAKYFGKRRDDLFNREGANIPPALKINKQRKI